MATEPALEGTLQGPAAWEQEAEREHVHGVGPWRLGMRRLRRNKVALFFGLLFVLLVLACLAAPLWAKHVAHTTATENHLSDTIVVDGKKTNVVSLDGVPIGPTYQGRVLPGGRPQRPRHHGAAALRRAQLADDRRRRRVDDHDPLDHPGGDRRLLPRLGRRDHPIAARHPVVVPGGDPGCGARRGPGARRHQARARDASGRLAAGSHLHHRAGLHPLHGEARARSGAVAAREGVRGGRRAPRERVRCGSWSPRWCPTSPRRSSSSSPC